MTTALEGRCTCGAVRWTLNEVPAWTATCNCTLCRRYGVLWTYGCEGEDMRVAGETRRYVRGPSIVVHFCGTCGCVAYWRGQAADEHGRRRMAVNLRLAEPDAVAAVRVEHLDGLVTNEALPDDGCRVADLWF